MTKLSVNINKIATLRNARGGNNPDVVEAARLSELFGAQGITVHPRPDGRHVKYSDVAALKDVVKTEFNIEGYPSESFINLVLDTKPTQVTLVPDSPEQLTSNHGWDTKADYGFLTDVVAKFNDAGIRTSLFVDPIAETIEWAKRAGAVRIELYTGPYADAYRNDRAKAIAPFAEAARYAKEIGLGVNAGHDLSLDNLSYFHACIPETDEVSIGHALICDALYLGMRDTIALYLECLK
jgi:pyridoxine 5-phosphate synthase